MRQDALKAPRGAKRTRKRVGRGVGSGHGTYSCRGLKGQKARSGGGVHPRFEGGQTPLVKRLPHIRGFANPFKVEYSVVNLDSLQSFDEGTEVTPDKLHAAGIVRSINKPVKILGDGDLRKALVVKANSFSQSARRKIEEAGGTVEQIP